MVPGKNDPGATVAPGGWTYGTVVESCWPSKVLWERTSLNYYYRILCSGEVHTGVGDGDSGAPFFYWAGDGSAWFYGILWGGDPHRVLFSLQTYIEMEIGSYVYY